jgi:hypothetical protein
VLQAIAEQAEDVIVIQGIAHEGPLLPVFDQSQIAQVPQLVGDSRRADRQQRGQLVDA